MPEIKNDVVSGESLQIVPVKFLILGAIAIFEVSILANRGFGKFCHVVFLRFESR